MFAYTSIVTYPGYGLDLGDLAGQFSGKNAKKLSNLWDEFINGESDALIDYSYEYYTKTLPNLWDEWLNNESDALIDYSFDSKTPQVTVIWPNITDDFKMLLLIPDVPGVQLEGNQTPRPTKAEANNLLYQELKNLLKAAQTDLDMSNDDINEILTQIKKPFYNNIDYHDSNEWSDGI